MSARQIEKPLLPLCVGLFAAAVAQSVAAAESVQAVHSLAAAAAGPWHCVHVWHQQGHTGTAARSGGQQAQVVQARCCLLCTAAVAAAGGGSCHVQLQPAAPRLPLNSHEQEYAGSWGAMGTCLQAQRKMCSCINLLHTSRVFWPVSSMCRELPMSSCQGAFTRFCARVGNVPQGLQ